MFSLFQSKKSQKKLPLLLTNTLSGSKEHFKPLYDMTVKMYNCGPTVYNYAHIGNLRSYLMADILRKTFEYNGYKVKQVINITDVGHLTSDADQGEDKVEKEAKAEKKSAKDITTFYTRAFLQDIKNLNVNTKGTIFCAATGHIKEQINLIKKLEQKGFTYRTADGVYFDTSKFKPYGKLGNINLEGLKEGARVDKNTEKKHPTDFALWKFSRPEDERQQEWPSPWGVGFPGWHIECSAMSMKYLGETLDIHTGGIDHIPVHHNNEIAQSEAVSGKPFARFWVHNAHINVEGTKMAKSGANFLTLSKLAENGIDPLSYRFWLLGARYSTPLVWNEEAVLGAQNGLKKLREHFLSLGKKNGKINGLYENKFHEAINDDLNTPVALATIWQLLGESKVSPEDKRATILKFDEVLGLDLKSLKVAVIPNSIKQLVNQRKIARDSKDWKESDKLRDEILKLGYEVKDTDNGVVITKK